ncbi:MAG: hypothetical protein AAGE52_01865 [Myxococcota bacterium]
MKRVLFFLLIAASLLSCGPETVVETGNPSAALIAQSGNPDIAFDNTGDLRIDEAWVSLRHLRFVPESRCADPSGVPVQVPGPFVVDLLARERVDLPVDEAERFCGLEIARTRVSDLPSGAPEELADASFVVIGERLSDGAEVRIARDFGGEVLLEIEDPGAEFSVMGPHFLVWDLSSILNLEIEETQAGDDGVIRINATSNTLFFDGIGETRTRSLSFHPDLDADGVLDDDEAAMTFAKVP